MSNIVKVSQKSSDEMPYVCIVILNWNGLVDTLACLGSLAGISYPNYKIVVVDNGSSNDEAIQIKKQFPSIALVRNAENLGFTGGCNVGIDEAVKMGASYVLLLNNDTIVTPDFLNPMVEFYENEPSAGMVSPLILYTDRKRVWFGGGKVVVGLIRHLHKGRLVEDITLPEGPFQTDYVPGTAMLISMQLIKKIGKLDNRYFAYYEDLDWCWKAKKLGRYPYLIPAAIIYHKKSGSTSEGGHRKFNKLPSYYMARNSLLLASNFKSFNKLFFVLAQLFIKLPLNMIFLVNPHAWSAYLRGTLAGLPFTFKKSE